MLLNLYRLLTILLAPLIELYLKKRLAAGKEDAARFRERFGHASIARPKGPLVWVHAASVGESISVLPLIQSLVDEYPKLHVLLTTGTVTSANMIQSRLPSRAYHQYVPVDSFFAVRRFLNYWRPDLALWVESEIWPNLIAETRKHCQLVLVNGRLSPASLEKWQRYPALAKSLMHRFGLVLPQTEADAKRLTTLGALSVHFIGNLKYAAPALPSDSKKMGELLGMIGQRTLWLAASTHKGEESMVAEVHQQLKEKFSDFLTIIVPRHPDRASALKDEFKALKLNVAMRSKSESVTEDTDIYLADTMGELGVLYRLVGVVFVGGSLVEHGGQNPLEPARLECAILFGPFMDNFREIAREMEEKGGAIRVADKTALQEKLYHLLRDHEQQEHLVRAAEKIAKKNNGVLESYMKALEPFLTKITNRQERNAA